MSQVGTFSQYALSVQEAQIALIRNNAEMQQKTVEILLENSDNLTVSNARDRGTIVDYSI
ncbi:MAG: hypothetical protein ACK5N8_05285 [Alphaproteobacteria bacterium]